MELTWNHRNCRRFETSHPFFCFHVMSPLHSPHPGLRPRVLPGLRPPRSGLGLVYISQCLLRLRLTCFNLRRRLGESPMTKGWMMRLFEKKTVK
jgi:hypothetical protein